VDAGLSGNFSHQPNSFGRGIVQSGDSQFANYLAAHHQRLRQADVLGLRCQRRDLIQVIYIARGQIGIGLGKTAPAFTRQAAAGIFGFGAGPGSICQQAQVFNLLPHLAGHSRDQGLLVIRQRMTFIGLEHHTAHLGVHNLNRFLIGYLRRGGVQTGLNAVLIIGIADAFILVNAIQVGIPAFVDETPGGSLSFSTGSLSRRQQTQALNLQRDLLGNCLNQALFFRSPGLGWRRFYHHRANGLPAGSQGRQDGVFEFHLLQDRFAHALKCVAGEGVAYLLALIDNGRLGQTDRRRRFWRCRGSRFRRGDKDFRRFQRLGLGCLQVTALNWRGVCLRMGFRAIKPREQVMEPSINLLLGHKSWPPQPGCAYSWSLMLSWAMVRGAPRACPSSRAAICSTASTVVAL